MSLKDSPEASARRAALTQAVQSLAQGLVLTEKDIALAFETVMVGEATGAEISALLLGLRTRGETAADLAGVVRVLRNAMIALAADRPGELVDTAGTGGGTVRTFNISTIAAFVAAGTGVRIAKHGNRSHTSQCGSADVLEALGVPLDASIALLQTVLAEAGIVFMYAPAMHPAMRHVAAVRRELGVPTIMNFVGPLANPAGAGRQVIGVADRARLPLVAAALQMLGTTHGLVVHGEPGLDEISPLGPTQVFEVRPDLTRQWTIDPRDFDLAFESPDDLAGGDPTVNATIAKRVLAGKGSPAARGAVALNAAAAIYVSGRTASYADALSLAVDALDRGAGLDALHRMQAAYDRT